MNTKYCIIPEKVHLISKLFLVVIITIIIAVYSYNLSLFLLTVKIDNYQVKSSGANNKNNA